MAFLGFPVTAVAPSKSSQQSVSHEAPRRTES
jgi:hypothetical protein